MDNKPPGHVGDIRCHSHPVPVDPLGGRNALSSHRHTNVRGRHASSPELHKRDASEIGELRAHHARVGYNRVEPSNPPQRVRGMAHSVNLAVAEAVALMPPRSATSPATTRKSTTPMGLTNAYSTMGI